MGISDCSCVAVTDDVVLVAESGELLQAEATRPIAIAAVTKADVLSFMIPPWLDAHRINGVGSFLQKRLKHLDPLRAVSCKTPVL